MEKLKRRRIAWRIVRFLALLYAAMIFTAIFAQRRLIYHPEKLPLDAAVSQAASAGFQPWRNAAGDLIGWSQTNAAPGQHPQLLIVHGNSGSAVDRVNHANGLKQLAPFDVYILEYPGFGPRPGKPTQSSLFAAADEAISLLKDRGPLYIIGVSLGTGVASYLAGKYPDAVRGLLLVAPYNNLTDLAISVLPLPPVRWFLLDRFPSETYLANYHGPVAVLLATEDDVIPVRFGRKLFDGYRGPKKIWEIPGANHNDVIDRDATWWAELYSFWNGQRN